MPATSWALASGTEQRAITVAANAANPWRVMERVLARAPRPAVLDLGATRPARGHNGCAMLTVHHLGRSQSERIVWLCEELGLDYELKRYERDPATRLAPAGDKALHPIGTAPVITDGGLVLGESGTIIEYIIAKYGGGRLARKAGHPEFADYLYWFHYANASFQALLPRRLVDSPPPAAA